MNPKYTIYIPSKGRYDTRLTGKALEEIGVPYKMVVEYQEYDYYAEHIDHDNLLVLPFSDQGLVPTRNWIRQYSIDHNERRHWQIDDNISAFMRLNRNRKIKVSSGTIFRAAEDFTDRYENIAFSGFNYDFFAKARQKIPPFLFNRRIYSMTLVNNEFDYWWRDTYNDDTDICLRALKDGNCTILFNAFLCCKAATMTIPGGLTELYKEKSEGRLKFAQSLVDQHPDVARVTWKFGRWHHEVDYSDFKKNKPILRLDIEIPEGINNYGMELKKIT